MIIPNTGFSKAERVCKRTEIDRIFKAGARYSCKGMRLHVMPNSLEVSRAVFVPVRSFPSAVSRNLARRLVREAWRLGKTDLKSGFDVAIVLYPGSDTFVERKTQLSRLLRQAGLLARSA